MSATLSRGLRHAVDRILFVLLGTRWISYRASRTWNRRAETEPLVATASHDAVDWDQYWASGRRDMDLLLGVARAAGHLRTGTALEIGCGMGRLAKIAANEFDTVLATDISERMLLLAREKASAANIHYHLLGSDQKLPAADESVDLVYAWTVFRHIPRESFEAYVDEASRVLRPGGVLAFEALIRDQGTPFKPSISNPVSEREYTPEELDSIRETHGVIAGARRSIASLTPGTSNLVLAWLKRGGSSA